ncbi:MAG: Gfo/Idh/MocA family protein [Armatimonadota bacterium]
MKKIGFIDYFIDEWHANNYPRMIRESRLQGQFDVALAWAEINPDGKKNLHDWCAEQGVAKAQSIEQVVEECDCLVVLSPDNAERHEDLARLPLTSGKPVYIDKPIAPSLEIAARLFARATEYRTPMMSSSALRFGSAFDEALREKIAGKPVRFANTRGGGDFLIYAIHQYEMLVMLLGTGARRVMHVGNDAAKLLVIDYADGRRGLLNQAAGLDFQLNATFGDDESLTIDTMPDFFPRFIDAMLTFFNTGISPIPVAQTLEIAALIEAGNTALATPDSWVAVPEVAPVG